MVTVQTRARINHLINGGRFLFRLLCRRSHLHPHVQTMLEVESIIPSKQNFYERRRMPNKPAGTICSSDPGKEEERRAPPPGPGIPGRGGIAWLLAAEVDVCSHICPFKVCLGEDCIVLHHRPHTIASERREQPDRWSNAACPHQSYRQSRKGQSET